MPGGASLNSLMQLHQEAVAELQQIILEEYGKNLTTEETKAVGGRLVNLYQTILIKNKNNKHEAKRLPPFPS